MAVEVMVQALWKDVLTHAETMPQYDTITEMRTLESSCRSTQRRYKPSQLPLPP